MTHDDGVPLDAALDALASPTEMSAIKAWRALNAADLAGLDALEATKRTIPLTFRQRASRFQERQKFATTVVPVAKSPAEVWRLQEAAKAALEPLARQLTADLRAGRRVMTYRPREAGAARQNVPAEQWEDLEVVLMSHGLSATVGMVPGGARMPAWLSRKGHRARNFLVHAACPIGIPKAAAKPSRSWSQSQENAATGHLMRLLDNADDATGAQVPKGVWQERVKQDFPTMPNEAWEKRIWPKAVKEHPQLRKAGRKPRLAPPADDP